MNNPVTSFNPARFTDLVVEDCYARAWGPGARLKRERKDRVKWLRKKANHAWREGCRCSMTTQSRWMTR